MNREGHNNVKFFTGTEVEHTPASGQKTLFVVGLQNASEILDILAEHRSHLDTTRHITHVYFGANMSFPSSIRTNDAVFWDPWENMIQRCLDAGYLCTLDIDVACVEGLLETALCEHNNFIPMISVKLPYIRQLGYNATVKLDDKDFDATNPGVWCHSLHTLQKRSVFTDWSKYTKDETIK
jgi:hypothetical protein